MTVNKLADTLGFVKVALPDGEAPVRGAYMGDLLSWVMGRAKAEEAWVTIMSNINIVAVAALSGVSCVILAEGVTVEEEVRQAAESRGVNLLGSDKPAYQIACLLRDNGV